MGKPGRTSDVYFLHFLISCSLMISVTFLFAVISETEEASVVRTFYLYGKAIADQVFRQRIVDCKIEEWLEELEMGDLEKSGKF